MSTHIRGLWLQGCMHRAVFAHRTNKRRSRDRYLGPVSAPAIEVQQGVCSKRAGELTVPGGGGVGGAPRSQEGYAAKCRRLRLEDAWREGALP